jgi:hypothetical protein
MDPADSAKPGADPGLEERQPAESDTVENGPGHSADGNSRQVGPSRAKAGEYDPYGVDAQQRAEEALDLNPPSLRLRTAELEFIPRVGSLLPTPRAVKKLINLYRLIRIAIPDGQLASFVGGPAGGPYQVVILLLAVIVGKPGTAAAAFTAIREEESAKGDIVTLLRNAATEDVSLDIAREFHRMADLIVSIRSETVIYSQVADYQTWLPIVARLSFFTYSLMKETS